MRITNWWDNLIWVVLFLFLVPSTLAVASWNSPTGSRLYRVKLATEKALIAIAPTRAFKSELQVAYTGRRLNEATDLLINNSSGEGLESFRKQVQEAKNALAMAPAGESRDLLTARYLETLQNASAQLQQQRQVISSRTSARPTYNRPPAGGITTAATTQQQVVVVNQITQVTQIIQVIQQIDQTQTEIDSAIHETQNQAVVPISPSSTPTPTLTITPTAITRPASVDALNNSHSKRSTFTPPTVVDPTDQAPQSPTSTPIPTPTNTPVPEPTESSNTGNQGQENTNTTGE